MGRRIKALAEVDPLAAPLPHGTEVTTRVDRLLGDRRVPEGTVGRVVGSAEDDRYDVQIVGLGVVRYARGELVARRMGQLAFAARREGLWSALRGCVVLESVVGSRAWGLDDAHSDEDRRGVFAVPFTWRAGLVAAPSDLVSSDGSATYWAVEKAVEQALRADPNTLEMLFVSSAEARDPIGEALLGAREAFVSREIYGSFARYALAQLRRLEQGQRLAEHRHLVLGWLRAEPDLSLDALATRLAAISPRAAPTEHEALAAAREWVKQLYRSLRDQGVIPRADLPALAEVAQRDAVALDLPREVRPKNAYNLLRLLYVARTWLNTGAPARRMEGDERARLFAIKRGEVPLDDVLDEAEALGTALDEVRACSPLPLRPDVRRVDALLRAIHEEVARRHVLALPGALGRDAPPPPPVAWEEP
jgi:hypothetical protein